MSRKPNKQLIIWNQGVFNKYFLKSSVEYASMYWQFENPNMCLLSIKKILMKFE